MTAPPRVKSGNATRLSDRGSRYALTRGSSSSRSVAISTKSVILGPLVTAQEHRYGAAQPQHHSSGSLTYPCWLRSVSFLDAIDVRLSGGEHCDPTAVAHSSGAPWSSAHSRVRVNVRSCAPCCGRSGETP